VLAGLLTGALLAVVGLASPAWAEGQVTWTESEPITGSVVDGDLHLTIESAGVHPLLVLDEPGVAPPRFALEGTIRHQDVEGTAYLEMWVVLPDGGRYFSRTLAEAGVLASMTGTSDARPFALPFELGEDGPTPSRLEINLVTEGAGEFWISPLTVVGGSAPSGGGAPLALVWVGAVGVALLGAVGTWLVMRARRRVAEERRMAAIDALSH
jgi:hypothetical protein